MSGTSLPTSTQFDNLASRDDLGPLTTTFTPAASCGLMIGSTSNRRLLLYQAQTCLALGLIQDNSACWPPVHDGTIIEGAFDGYGVYSPGYICPLGYVSACVQIGNSSLGGTNNLPNSGETSNLAAFEFQFPPTGAERAVGCCPTYVSLLL